MRRIRPSALEVNGAGTEVVESNASVNLTRSMFNCSAMILLRARELCSRRRKSKLSRSAPGSQTSGTNPGFRICSEARAACAVRLCGWAHTRASQGSCSWTRRVRRSSTPDRWQFRHFRSGSALIDGEGREALGSIHPTTVPSVLPDVFSSRGSVRLGTPPRCQRPWRCAGGCGSLRRVRGQRGCAGRRQAASVRQEGVVAGPVLAGNARAEICDRLRRIPVGTTWMRRRGSHRKRERTRGLWPSNQWPWDTCVAEAVEGLVGALSGIGYPDVVDQGLGLGLEALGQFVQEANFSRSAPGSQTSG